MIPKPTNEDISFALINFDSHGWLYNYSHYKNSPLERLQRTGLVRYKFNTSIDRYGYCTLGVLYDLIVAREILKIVPLIAITAI